MTKPRCPRCNSNKRREYHSGRVKITLYRCKKCGRNYSELTGTIHAGAKVPLEKIKQAELIIAGNPEISAYQLAKKITVSWTAASELKDRILGRPSASAIHRKQRRLLKASVDATDAEALASPTSQIHQSP